MLQRKKETNPNKLKGNKQAKSQHPKTPKAADERESQQTRAARIQSPSDLLFAQKLVFEVLHQ